MPPLDPPSRMKDALVRGASSLGISLSADVAARLAEHYALLVKWAEKINITAVLDPEEAASVHYLDSLLVAELFEETESSSVIDVGSGGGFPGIVLALARPALRIALLEPQRKRASFLRTALASLGRSDVQVRQERLDADNAARLEAEVLVSRATLPPLELVGRASEVVGLTRLIVMRGGAPDELKDAALVAKAEEVGFRHLRELRRTLPTGGQRRLDEFRR